MTAPTYMFDAADKPSLPSHRVPVVKATDASLKGYGCLVDDPDSFEIEITRWPAQGWRPVDEDCGDEGGVAEGIFHSDWRGDVLYGSNQAVAGNYVLGWSTADPKTASADRFTCAISRVCSRLIMNSLKPSKCVQPELPASTVVVTPLGRHTASADVAKGTICSK